MGVLACAKCHKYLGVSAEAGINKVVCTLCQDIYNTSSTIEVKRYDPYATLNHNHFFSGTHQRVKDE